MLTALGNVYNNINATEKMDILHEKGNLMLELYIDRKDLRHDFCVYTLRGYSREQHFYSPIV